VERCVTEASRHPFDTAGRAPAGGFFGSISSNCGVPVRNCRRPRQHNCLVKTFHVPTVLAKIQASQSSSSGWLGAHPYSKISVVSTRPCQISRPHPIDVTLVSGFAALTVHSARASGQAARSRKPGKSWHSGPHALLPRPERSRVSTSA